MSWNRIFNCDETSCLLQPNGILSGADVGAESVQAKIEGNENEIFTVVASVTVASDSLPLDVIPSEKAIRVEATQIGHVDGHWPSHS
jgi:hypothetical protein